MTKSAPYYNIGQLRVDYWNKLKIVTSELARCNNGSANAKKHIIDAKSLLKDLKGVAVFFATPGTTRISKLEKALDRKEYSALSNMVAETTKQLVGDSYKSNPDFIDYDEKSIESVEEHEQFNTVKKNHFEVLFVDNMSVEEENELKNSFSNLRAPGDKFTYGIVVQRSFQDAMITLCATLLFKTHYTAY